MSIQRIVVENGAHFVLCERPGYHKLEVTDVNGSRHSYYVGHVSAIESLCALSDMEKTAIERAVRNFAERRFYPFAVAEMRTNDEETTATSSFVDADVDSSVDIHKKRYLKLMGLVPLNYCPSEEAKRLVESLKSLNISIQLAGFSQKFLLEKICEDFGIDNTSEAVYDASLYPSTTLINASLLEVSPPSDDDMDIQSAVREEVSWKLLLSNWLYGN